MSHLKLFMNKGSVSVHCSSWMEYVLNKQNSFSIICLFPCIMVIISILKTICSAFKKSILSSRLSQEKVDCITVNCEPVRNVVDDLIQRLFDILLLSLRKSIQGKDAMLIVYVFISFCAYVHKYIL